MTTQPPNPASRTVGDLPLKPFCPCDTGRPQDCKPEAWPGAHAQQECRVCGCPDYQHAQYPDLTDPEHPVVLAYCPPPEWWKAGQARAAADRGEACLLLDRLTTPSSNAPSRPEAVDG